MRSNLVLGLALSLPSLTSAFANRLARAERASTEAAELARLRYREGVANFLEVLDAERVQLTAQDQLVSSEISAATALAALYKALGGGWQAALR